MTREQITGSAPATTLAGAINAAVTSFSITSGTGWPTGTPGPFVATIDRGLATEEKILVTSRSGTSLTGITRGHDGSTAQSHTNLAVIEHTISAAMLDEANRIVNEQTGAANYASGTTAAEQSKVTGDGNARFIRDASGKMTWGPGSATQDVQLQRLQADMLELQDELRLLRATNVQILSARVGAESVDRFNIDASGKHQWGSGAGAVDTNLFRVSADVLRTDDYLEVGQSLAVTGASTITGVHTAGNYKRGTGSPEGAVTGNVGDVYQRTNGAVATSLYIKESGSGNTGWAALVTTPTRLLYETYADSATTANGSDTDLASTTVGAGVCVAGDALRVKAWGNINKNAGTSGTLKVKLKLGTTVIFAGTATLASPSAGSTVRWDVEFIVGFITQSSQRAFIRGINGQLGTTILDIDSAAENFSTSKTVAITVNQGYSDNVLTTTLQGMTVERLVA